MLTDIDVLSLVGERLDAQGIPYMLTGSVAMAYYATPRMTRDLDIVVELDARNVDALVAAMSGEFYIDADAARDAIRSERLFNLMHLGSAIKVDLIIRKSATFRQMEFTRRKFVPFAGIHTWIVSREDLILSKLVWAQGSGSDLQKRDVHQLLAGPVEIDYLNKWAPILGVQNLLREQMP
jgi:hypothetical protein